VKPHQLAGMAGFVALGLSPSFVDFQQEKNTSRRLLIVGYYAFALALIWFGVFRP